MPAPATALAGDQLLAAVTEAMVTFHQRYHHRKPVTAKTLMLGDDLLARVLGGVDTDVEKMMIEIQRQTIVQETRKKFQNAMQDKFIKAIERLTGRNVLAFISNHHLGPDIENRTVPAHTGPNIPTNVYPSCPSPTRSNLAAWKQRWIVRPLRRRT
jgi:uncharacterized protein YbcI